MTAMLDAGPLVTVAENTSPEAMSIRAALERERGPLIIPAPVTAEVDYLLSRPHFGDAPLQFIADIAAGRFSVECLTASEYATVLQLAQRYRDLRPALADLSVVVLAHRFGTLRVFTNDVRRFRAITSLSGAPFTLLPWDER